jgi:flagellar biosynthetic protein FliR
LVSLLKDWIFRDVLLLGLVVARISGFVVASPFPGADVPRPQKIGLVCALGYVSMLTAAAPAHPLVLDGMYLISAAVEVAFGVAIAFVFRLLLAGAEAMGELVSQGTGLGAPALLNPTLGTEETAISRVITLLAMLLAFACGAHRVALAYLIRSFEAVPVGGDLHIAGALPLFTELAGQSIAIGLRLAMPVVAVSLVTQVALALVARLAPTLQIFNIGFAVLIAAGLLTFSASLPDVSTWLGEHFASVGNLMDRAMLGMAPGG